MAPNTRSKKGTGKTDVKNSKKPGKKSEKTRRNGTSGSARTAATTVEVPRPSHIEIKRLLESRTVVVYLTRCDDSRSASRTRIEVIQPEERMSQETQENATRFLNNQLDVEGGVGEEVVEREHIPTPAFNNQVEMEVLPEGREEIGECGESSLNVRSSTNEDTHVMDLVNPEVPTVPSTPTEDSLPTATVVAIPTAGLGLFGMRCSIM